MSTKINRFCCLAAGALALTFASCSGVTTHDLARGGRPHSGFSNPTVYDGTPEFDSRWDAVKAGRIALLYRPANGVALYRIPACDPFMCSVVKTKSGELVTVGRDMEWKPEGNCVETRGWAETRINGRWLRARGNNSLMRVHTNGMVDVQDSKFVNPSDIIFDWTKSDFITDEGPTRYSNPNYDNGWRRYIL